MEDLNNELIRIVKGEISEQKHEIEKYKKTISYREDSIKS